MQTTTLCPVCFGKGTVKNGFYNYGVASTSGPLFETCRSCEGLGVIKTESIKVSIDMSEAADVFALERDNTAIQILTLIKHEFNRNDPLGLNSWTKTPGVEQILKLYFIDPKHIQ